MLARKKTFQKSEASGENYSASSLIMYNNWEEKEKELKGLLHTPQHSSSLWDFRQ